MKNKRAVMRPTIIKTAMICCCIAITASPLAWALEYDPDNRLIAIWQTSAGYWFACEPTQCTNLGKKNKDKAWDYAGGDDIFGEDDMRWYEGEDVKEIWRHLGSHGRCQVFQSQLRREKSHLAPEKIINRLSKCGDEAGHARKKPSSKPTQQAATQPGTPSPSAQEMGHAALAIDRQDGFYVGWAYNYPVQSQADSRALRECNDRGGKCSIVARRAGPGCIVYRTVDSDVGTAYGWASAMHRLRADSKANAECLKRSNGQPCSNQAYACNSDRIVKQKKPPSKPAPQAAKQPASAQQGPDATPGRTMSALGALHRAVLFVIDKSGSMDGQKIRDAKHSAIAAAGRALDRNVQVGMLAFSGDCGGAAITDHRPDHRRQL